MGTARTSLGLLAGGLLLASAAAHSFGWLFAVPGTLLAAGAWGAS